MNWSTLIVSYPVELIFIISLVAGCMLVCVLISFRKDKPHSPLNPEDEAAVKNYLRENPAPSLLISNSGVVPLYALDDRFMRKINKIEINGELYNAKAVWKRELVGTRNSGYFLECTAYKSPMLSFDAAQLRQLKKDSNIILYQFMEFDFSDEEA